MTGSPAGAPSPLLSRPGAVAADGVDAGVAAHYGDPFREQRLLDSGDGVVDLSTHGVVRVSGPDRLSWLHSLTTQHLSGLYPGELVEALLLSPHGHVEHAMRLRDDGATTTLVVEPGTAPALVEFLQRMRFLLRVEVADATAEAAVLWTPERGEVVVPRAGLEREVAATGSPLAGVWAREALRVAAGRPRLGVDTDARTLPNEVGWVPSAVHLDKGCYRGQETVARVHTLGRPPRRLALLHLDGTAERLPAHGAAVVLDERTVGTVGTAVRHFELGPLALALVKRAVPVDAGLLADGVAATQEVVVDPDVGLHVRPRLA